MFLKTVQNGGGGENPAHTENITLTADDSVHYVTLQHPVTEYIYVEAGLVGKKSAYIKEVDQILKNIDGYSADENTLQSYDESTNTIGISVYHSPGTFTVTYK